MRCDDSVSRVVAGQTSPIRRSRGEAPVPLDLPIPCRRPILALGGQLKSTFTLGRGGHGFLSHHLGDLDHYEAFRAYVDAIEHYQNLFAIRPELVVHDLHPDYASTRHAKTLDPAIPRLAVQHHHAHIASCMTENRLDEVVIGLAFDGNGHGTDGAVWGGEFLVGDYRGFRRAAHFRDVAMPGGDRAIREPWRMAAAHLIDAGLDLTMLGDRIAGSTRSVLRHMIETRLNAPPTSSVGRLFDAVASLVGVRDFVSYEGQAAVELEAIAKGSRADGVYPFDVEGPIEDRPILIDTRPLIREVVEEVRRGRDAATIGRRFHATLVEVATRVCSRLRDREGISAVVLSGGVFQNALLTEELVDRLTRDGFRTYRHRLVPPGDGGLSLGQLAIASAVDAMGPLQQPESRSR